MPSTVSAPAAKSASKAVSPRADVVLTEAALLAMPAADYMNDRQLEFFRRRLLDMKEEIEARQSETRQELHQHQVYADPADRATAEEEHALALRLREREVMLLAKVEQSLRRIHDREYGYCTKSGDPIGLARLLARPTATVCVQVKDRDERVQTHYRTR